ncbi:hypothetical protein Tco_0683484 [Tanacetum coccineum]|uniref:Reverse transcriptase domain-containing protein n=1 Tax=Tanacetum coccineum TaxID=301880 RepID=A0ABQ4XU38_9ASTR
MADDCKPSGKAKTVNPKIHEVIKKEVIKLLDAGMIYPISDSPWVSPIHCVPKKGGMTVVANEENELILTRLVTGWRIPIDPHDQEKTTFTCPYGTFAYRRMPFGLCNAPGTFQRLGISQPDGPNFQRLISSCETINYGGDIPPKVRINQKSQENSQKRASTDTRIRRVQKSDQKPEAKPEKSSPQSNPVNNGQTKCPQLDQTATIDAQMIEEMIGQD